MRKLPEKPSAQLQSEVQVCKSKFQSSGICKINCQKGRYETEVSLANLAVKFAGLEISLANRLKWYCSVCYYTIEIRLEN